jgi:hypothetical protein
MKLEHTNKELLDDVDNEVVTLPNSELQKDTKKRKKPKKHKRKGKNKETT